MQTERAESGDVERWIVEKEIRGGPEHCGAGAVDLGVFAGHFAKAGRGLDTAVGAYNQAVKSFDIVHQIQRRPLGAGRSCRPVRHGRDDAPNAHLMEI